MKQFKVGLQLWGVRDELAKDFEGTLQAVKDMGYDYVEFAGFYDRTAEEVKAIIDKIGLEGFSVHQGEQLFKEKGQEAIDYLATVGVKYCAIPWYGLCDKFEQAKKDFTEYSAALKKAGIKLLYHNHDFEFKKEDGKYFIDKLYEELPRDVISPEFDTCWVHYAGENPCEYIEKYSGAVEVIHLKDFVCTKLGGGPVYDLVDKNGNGQGKGESKEDNGFMYKPVGYGIQDIPAILAAAEKAGTEYVVVEQDEAPEHTPLEAAKLSREYLRSLGL